MPIAPTDPDLLPQVPSSNRPTNFSAIMDAFLAALPVFRSQLISLASNCFNNALEALNSATEAALSALAASNSASTATIKAAEAAASAATAVSAPGTSATSGTSLSVAMGSQTLTIQPGKSLAPGSNVMIARTSDPAGVYMGGIVTEYNSVSGSLSVLVLKKYGSGTYSDWTVSISGIIGIDGALSEIYKAANFNAVAGYTYIVDTTAGEIAVLLPPTPVDGDFVRFRDVLKVWDVNNFTLGRNGKTITDALGNPVAEDLICDVAGIEFTIIYKSSSWRLV